MSIEFEKGQRVSVPAFKGTVTYVYSSVPGDIQVKTDDGKFHEINTTSLDVTRIIRSEDLPLGTVADITFGGETTTRVLRPGNVTRSYGVRSWVRLDTQNYLSEDGGRFEVGTIHYQPEVSK